MEKTYDITVQDKHMLIADGFYTSNCSHPDIVEFITAKQTHGRLTKFNMSVNCTDDFMYRVNAITQHRKDIEAAVDTEFRSKEEVVSTYEKMIAELDAWPLIFPNTTHHAYKSEWQGNIKNWQSKGYPVVTYQTLSVMWLWNLITESTYNRNEPGVLFLERANRLNPLSYRESVLSSNPCAEQMLPPNGVCCLATQNLVKFLNREMTGFDIPKIRKYAAIMVRLLDNVNSYSDAPLPGYKWSMENTRRIGCGLMGWGSSLLMLKVRFGSPEAKKLRDEVTFNFAQAVYMASIDLAVEKGMFSVCVPEKHAKAEFIQRLKLPEEYMQKLRTTGIRNSCLLSNQPNGNKSIEAGIVTGGIEPCFMFEFTRTKIESFTPEHIKAVTPAWQEGVMGETAMFKWTTEGDEPILRGVDEFGTVYKIDYSRGLTREVPCMDYGVRYLKSKGEWDPTADWAVSTEQLSVDAHLEDLEGFASMVDSSCSKTCNLPHDYPFSDFQDLYLKAYNTGTIKGFTTYRAGTMASVLSATKETPVAEEEVILEDIKLPDSSPATLKVLRAEKRKWYLTVLLNDTHTRPIAIFVQTNASEKNAATNDAVDKLIGLARSKGLPSKYIEEVLVKMAGDSNTVKVCRVLSLLLRHGVLIKNIINTFDEISCFAGSFVFHLRKYLASFIKDGEKSVGEKCGNCGSEAIVYKEGCKICMNCGNSKCG